MRLSDIKTMKQFWEVGDVWYQRTLKLAEIWQDDDIEESKRLKAFNLWNYYKDVTLKMTLLANKLQIRQHNYPSGKI